MLVILIFFLLTQKSWVTYLSVLVTTFSATLGSTSLTYRSRGLNIWDASYDLVPICNLKNLKDTHGGVFL